jgi:NADPH2:quinone reductase
MPEPSNFAKRDISKMKAQLLIAFGGPENFRLTEVPKPVVQDGTLLIRLAATSVNSLDIKIREGGIAAAPKLPGILGSDIAGTVEEVGQGVIGFSRGDEVYGCAGGIKGFGGTLAEYIVADAKLIALKPKILSFREAAALPLVSITAWEGLERAKTSSSDHVLVHGGTGGVGHIALQLARVIGARIATTVAENEDSEIAQTLGADETINYHEENVDQYVDRLTAGRGFDVVFDTIGGKNLELSLAAAASSGRISTTNGRTTLDLSEAHSKGLSFHVIFMMLPLLENRGRERHGRILRDIATLVDGGKLRPLLDAGQFALETAPDAHRRLQSGKAKGKVVIDLL